MKVFEDEQAAVRAAEDAEDPQHSLGEEHDRLVRPLAGAHPELEDDWCDLAAQLADQAGDRDRAAALLLQGAGVRWLVGRWPRRRRRWSTR